MTITVFRRLFAMLSLLTALAAGALGCATSSLSFQSQPLGAEVYARKLGSVEKPVLLGETPLQLSAAELESRALTPGPIQVEIVKEGYRPFQTILTQIPNTDISLAAQLPPSSGLDDIDQLNGIVDRVFEAQRLARAGRYDDALAALKLIQKDAPQLAASYEIEGGIYYLQKKYQQAFDAFKLAAKYNPRSVQAVRMRETLRKPGEPAKEQERKPAEAETSQAPATPPAPAPAAKKGSAR